MPSDVGQSCFIARRHPSHTAQGGKLALPHPPTRGRAALAMILTTKHAVVKGAKDGNINVKIDFDDGLISGYYFTVVCSLPLFFKIRLTLSRSSERPKGLVI
jgi:hypothetical protein